MEVRKVIVTPFRKEREMRVLRCGSAETWLEVSEVSGSRPHIRLFQQKHANRKKIEQNHIEKE